MSDERREHDCCDEEYRHTQKHNIDDVIEVADDGGALAPQGFTRSLGPFAPHIVSDRCELVRSFLRTTARGAVLCERLRKSNMSA